jgi:peptidoglycan/LPS O-acetylase OafA/YrhL
MSIKPTGLDYVKGLDGIRGIAVLLVILIHSHLCSFGWVGVQMFFVLSGFLITRILVSESGQDLKSYLLRFYWRRGLRIWPVYFGFLILCGVSYLLIEIPETMGAAWIWLTTFTYNLVRYLPGFNDSNYFGHFWTLCVEEQFYFVWPFVVFFLSRAWLQRVVIALVVVGPLVRLLSALWLGTQLEMASAVVKGVHNWPTSHMDAFACGALLAVLPAKLTERFSNQAIKLFICMCLLTVVAGLAQAWICQINNRTPSWLALGYGGLVDYYQYTWAYTLLNMTSAALVWCAIHENWIAKLLRTSWLVHIGKISFGLYVIHLPLMHISHRIWPASYHSPQGLLRFVIYFAVCLAVASTSYRFFEKRFLALKDSGWGTRKSKVETPIVARAES